MTVTTDCPEVSVVAAPVERVRPRHARRSGALALPLSMVVSFLAASAAPVPLWAHYGAVWHGGALVTTAAFATYAGAVLVGLLVLGEVSNHLGRVPVLLAALALQTTALLLFAGADGYPPIFVGRVLQGLAAGAALGTLGALMIEAHRERGTLASAAAPGVGTGTGSLLAALLVAYLPWPTHLVYLVLVGVFTVQAVALLRIGESSPRRPGLRRSLRPTVAVPGRVRPAFVAVAPVLFAVWALPGFFSSLGPVLIRRLAHSPSVLLGGLGLFLLATVATVATVVLRDLTAARTMLVGVLTLLVGLVGLVGGLLLGLPVVYLVATVPAGAGFGSALQGAMRSVVSLAAPDERPGLLSAAYLVSYAGLGLPAVLAGVLVSLGLPVDDVATGYLAAVAGLVLLGYVSLRRATR
ncbi:MFS family permease [Friedmanniella endophytica]|uniref:MFS family permease n=1 Tax=Microlunatus kandeliicorticis TaxID=1759536 RepID=A0A7W3IRA8_9ACTN|nr:MFS transporter [Microlunatus kandeliicorticis]MBA8793765.1 MFS family permease [Microlunatus kandeliicorticis]